jgi:hypothetical protein
MGGWTIDRRVVVVDNGVRSFIPPNFCFELRDQDGAIVTTVSRVVLDVPRYSALEDFEALELLGRENHTVTGSVSDYDAGPEAREQGRMFTVRSVWPPFEKG